MATTTRRYAGQRDRRRDRHTRQLGTMATLTDVSNEGDDVAQLTFDVELVGTGLPNITAGGTLPVSAEVDGPRLTLTFPSGTLATAQPLEIPSRTRGVRSKAGGFLRGEEATIPGDI